VSGLPTTYPTPGPGAPAGPFDVGDDALKTLVQSVKYEIAGALDKGPDGLEWLRNTCYARPADALETTLIYQAEAMTMAEWAGQPRREPEGKNYLKTYKVGILNNGIWAPTYKLRAGDINAWSRKPETLYMAMAKAPGTSWRALMTAAQASPATYLNVFGQRFLADVGNPNLNKPDDATKGNYFNYYTATPLTAANVRQVYIDLTNRRGPDGEFLFNETATFTLCVPRNRDFQGREITKIKQLFPELSAGTWTGGNTQTLIGEMALEKSIWMPADSWMIRADFGAFPGMMRPWIWLMGIGIKPELFTADPGAGAAVASKAIADQRDVYGGSISSVINSGLPYSWIKEHMPGGALDQLNDQVAIDGYLAYGMHLQDSRLFSWVKET
jgi:hypothetical protein